MQLKNQKLVQILSNVKITRRQAGCKTLRKTASQKMKAA